MSVFLNLLVLYRCLSAAISLLHNPRLSQCNPLDGAPLTINDKANQTLHCNRRPAVKQTAGSSVADMLSVMKCIKVCASQLKTSFSKGNYLQPDEVSRFHDIR